MKEKIPDIEVHLVDKNDAVSNHIVVKPVYLTKRIISLDIKKPHLLEQAEKAVKFLPLLGPKEPPKNLVPIMISVSNKGLIPAHNIQVYLLFPEDCELLEEDDVIGYTGYLSSVNSQNRTFGGLYLNEENTKEAICWIIRLGNDRKFDNFYKIFVKFPDNEETYVIEATVIQDTYEPKQIDLNVTVKPSREDYYVYEYLDDDSNDE